MNVYEIINFLEKVEKSSSYEEAKEILLVIEEKLNFYGLAKMYLDEYSFYHFSIPVIAQALNEYYSLADPQKVNLIRIIEELRSGELSEIMEIIYNSVLERYLKTPDYYDLVRDDSLSPEQVIKKGNEYQSIILGGNTE